LPAIRDSVSVIYRKKGTTYEVNFLHKASGLIKPFELNDQAFRCLEYFDGNHSVSQIAHLMGLPHKEVARLSAALGKANLLARGGEEKSGDSGRWARQLSFLADFETPSLTRLRMQRRISRATVAIVGIGGIGSWVAYGLALAGVGRFILIDPDTVSVTNLGGQCLFTEQDLGKHKTVAMERGLKRINPMVTCQLFNLRLKRPHESARLVRSASLVVNCADEPDVDAMNRILTTACFAAKTPHILSGGYDGHLGFLGPTVIPGKSACWYCYEEWLDNRRGLRGYRHLMTSKAAAVGGSIAAISAVSANYHVLEGIKVLSGCMPPALLNATAEINFMTFEMRVEGFGGQAACSICSWTKRRGRGR
jgi:molybdopterin/thiamine biosynthesis adenylyltransferase